MLNLYRLNNGHSYSNIFWPWNSYPRTLLKTKSVSFNLQSNSKILTAAKRNKNAPRILNVKIRMKKKNLTKSHTMW